ncbi:MAG: hypothetical protein QFB87_04050 [Patescibacteria group bacterium]|nr:hypothetical protein [Patescibacteria group bacterium]
MEDYPDATPDVLDPVSVQEAAAIWQRRLDAVSSRDLGGTAIEAINAMNKRLYAQPEMQPDEPLLFSCSGYFEDQAQQFLEYRDEDQQRTYYGLSDGVNVIQVPRAKEDDIDLVLVHSVSVIARNSIHRRGSHTIEEIAHIPVSESNFLPVQGLAEAFTSPTNPSDNHSEEVSYLAQEFTNCRDRLFVKGYVSRADAEKNLTTIINQLEALIGPRGCGLFVESPFAYVVDTDSTGVMKLRPSYGLRAAGQRATFLGVGDFAALDTKLIAVDYREFNYDRHQGLYMAVALSEQATDRAGLARQALLLPLSGNRLSYDYC